MPDPFVHLHTASSYSLRYGTAHPEFLARRAAEHGMDALALTDRDGLYAAVKHARACQQAGVRPILGTDLALAGGGRVTLLAQGRAGWASLCRLVSATHLGGERGERRSRADGEYGAAGEPGERAEKRANKRGEPMTSRELIAAHATGLVVLLGPDSDVGRAVSREQPGLARVLLAQWREVAEVAVEVVHHRGLGETARATQLLALAREENVPAVLTNAVRYLDPADAPVADVLDAARDVAPLERRRVHGRTAEGYLKSGKEMAEVAEDACGPDRDAARSLLASTRKLADRCAIDPHGDLGMGVAYLPEVTGDPYAALRGRCEAGLARRGMAERRKARARLEEELAIIETMALPAYFITVADAADLIRSLGIRCAVRGSGAGSLVTHLLGISEIDPLAHGLLMERFLCEGRGGLPDIDLDVESARRLEAYQAILERYGDERCACVSMMETYRARGAIREVGAALGLPPYEIDAIAKAFPHIRASQIGTALTELPELRRSGLGQEQLAGVFRLAQRLDGLPRHIALHPCGIVLSGAGMRDRTPVERSFLGFPMSQFDKDDVEEMGLLKLDVIGVRMQSAMTHAVDEIQRVEGESVELDAVPWDDPAAYRLIRSTHTLGCFQIESPGQRELVGKLEPDDLDDLILDISLFRPGPVNSDMVTPYLEARHGWRAPAYPHRDLAEILTETGGVVVFHEQVLRILVAMTGCSFSDAEEARRALDDPVGGEEVRTWFQAGAAMRGYDRETIERVWKVLAAFGAFGFCKAHAAAFALPTYQSAWLKAHYPAAFFAGVLTHEPGMYPKRMLVGDARRFGVPVLGLDVNASGAQWQVEPRRTGGEQVDDQEGQPTPYALRVSLAEVKGISAAEVDRIVAGQHYPYRSLPDFWHRAGVSRPVVERIIQVGGFDELYGIRSDVRGDATRWRTGRITRRDLLIQIAILDKGGHVARGNCPAAGRPVGGRHEPPGGTWAEPTYAADRRTEPRAADSGQLPLGIDESPAPGGLPEMTERDRVRAELDILGVDVTRHVLSFYDDLLTRLGIVRARDLLRCRSGADVLVAGAKTATQTPPVRSGQRVIFATLDDATGPVDVTFFESVQDDCAATVFGSWLLVVRGRVRRTGSRGVSLRATGCWDLTELHRQWRSGQVAASDNTVSAATGEVGGEDRSGMSGQTSPADSLARPPVGSLTATPSAAPPRKLWHTSPGSSGS